MTTVVLLHGLGSSPRSWDRVAPLLRERFEVVTPRSPGGPIERKATAALGALRDAGGARGDVLAVGHSMGGLTACAMAEQGAGLVRGLVLVNAPPTVASRLSAGSRLEQLVRKPVIGPLLWRLSGDDRRRKAGRSAFAPGTPVPDVFVEDLAATPWDVFASSTQGIDDYLAARPLHDRVRDLGLPTTVVFGERDGRVDPASLAGYEGVPGVTVERIPEAGHTPILEAPERVAALIERAGLA